MKLLKLRAEIQAKRRRIEAQLRRMYANAANLEFAATIPRPLKHDPLGPFSDDAKERAMLLFWRHLTPAQRSEFTRQRWFTVIGGYTGCKYRVSPLRAVREESGFTRFFWLVLLNENTPLEDQMLAKKILIEKDEHLFLNTAVNQGLYPLSHWNDIVKKDGP